MTTLIVNEAGDVLVIEPPRDREGRVILPYGVECSAVEVSELEAAKLGQANARYRVEKGAVVVTPVEPDPPAVSIETRLAALEAAIAETVAVAK